MYTTNGLWIASANEKKIYLCPKMGNRHGLIAGATGTGKTITMKVLAESFSAMGVPVFLADVKGDVSGMCEPGVDNENMRERIARFEIEGWEYTSYPTVFWDIFGEHGHPVRTTVSEMGPTLLSRLMGLTEVQEGVLNIVFRVADDNGLMLLDLKDLRAMLKYVGDNRAEFTTEYGNVSTASVGAIQRALLRLEDEGGDVFFGEPALSIKDWIRTDAKGRGVINILHSAKLIANPTIYSTFLLWMLSELFEQLPEVGDLEKPRLVFFFDEAHLLFEDAPKALKQKIEQVVKLIRSKGVGVYFVTQNPSDIPDDVLAQLGNRVQHALRAFTPAEMKAVRAAAQSFRVNSEFKTEEVIMELGVGEALVSFLDEEGIPMIVERSKILPPQSLMGPADEGRVNALIASGEFDLKYRDVVDRESAYEVIMEANAELERQAEEAAIAEAEAKEAAKAEKAAAKASAAKKKKTTSTVKKTAERAVSSAASSVSRSISTNIVKSITGGKKVSTKQMAERAATNALSSVLRNTTNSIIRGLFGNKKG